MIIAEKQKNFYPESELQGDTLPARPASTFSGRFPMNTVTLGRGTTQPPPALRFPGETIIPFLLISKP